jgi:aerobic carbon-monoxide dehydrogenase small subunit
MRLECTVNGDPCRREIEPDRTLLAFLREDLALTGTKWGCLTGDCGSCTVLVDGQPVVSCLQLAIQCRGRAITTIEGIGESGRLDDLQSAFVEHGGAQCGFCTPGMVMSAEALLVRDPDPDEATVRAALVGNLCRCTGYNKIVDAILATATRRREQRG